MARVSPVDVITNAKLDNEVSVGGNCVVAYGTYNHPTHSPSPLTDRPKIIAGSDWADIESRLTNRFDHTYYNSVNGGGV